MFRNVYAIVVFLVFAGLCGFAYGQEAQIQGQILDTSGAGITKAIIHVSDQQTGTERTIQSNDNGQYTVPGLAAGAYKIIVEAPGFGAAVSDAITLNPGQSMVMDFTLRVGGTSADIVVTAEKKEERLQDTPVPVTVLNANALADNGQLLLRDYYASVPGLDFTANAFLTQRLTIRGITTGGYSNPTVGILVDDVPFGGSTNYTGSNVIPDIDPGDLARIEVLRGPQGTLYGASGVGGLIKYVTKDPSFDRYSGRVEVGTSGVHNGAESGFNFRASANIPLSDTLAIRVSGFKRQDPGYIDNPVLNLKGVNEAQANGARLAALWQQSENFSVKLSALYQNVRGNGHSEVEQLPGLGDLQQDFLPRTGAYDQNTQAYSANLSYMLGDFDLTSVTGYNIKRYSDSTDYTFAFGSLTQQVPPGVTASPFIYHESGGRVTQEIRLSGAMSSRFELLAGGFYSHERNLQYDIFGAATSAGQFLGATYQFSGAPFYFHQYAGFANVTYHVTERLDVQIGGRETHVQEINEAYNITGPLVPYLFAGQPSPYLNPRATGNANAFTYLVTPSFKVSPDILVYARLASGFRPGGVTSVVPEIGVVPDGPDKTYDYEVGLKGDLFDHALSFDTSLYYTSFKNIQLSLLTPHKIVYVSNGGNAKSEGVEVSATARPWRGLPVSAWISYDDAVMTQPPPNAAVNLFPGDRLPDASKWSGDVSVEKDFPLWSTATGFVGGEVSYVGDRLGDFQDTAERQTFPAYTKLNLNSGIRFNTWTANIYASNVADVRGLLNGGLGYTPPNAYVYIQPRTVGVSLSKTF